jgi:hypothetical protein
MTQQQQAVLVLPIQLTPQQQREETPSLLQQVS